MKNGKRLLCTVCAGIVALCLLLSGCSILGKKEEKVRDLTITPVSDRRTSSGAADADQTENISTL